LKQCRAAEAHEDPTMPRVAMAFGIVLMGLSVGAYAYARRHTDHPSPTAFIPAGFGLMFVILGFLARNENLRKHVMHAAVVVGLFGAVFPGVRSGPDVVAWLGGEEPKNPVATATQAAMAVVCAVFVLLCVRSFVAARRARAERERPAAGL
jgi:hypothetical protein